MTSQNALLGWVGCNVVVVAVVTTAAATAATVVDLPSGLCYYIYLHLGESFVDGGGCRVRCDGRGGGTGRRTTDDTMSCNIHRRDEGGEKKPVRLAQSR